ncbi:MAG: hypothetical protein HZA01_10950 [Nitrospinae bacterium]|nr:hypothetical protein [Nitrospinota bacterium]
MAPLVAVKCAFTSPLIPLEKGEWVVSPTAGFLPAITSSFPLGKGGQGDVKIPDGSPLTIKVHY